MDKTGARDEKFMRYAMAAHGSSVYLVALAQTRSEHDAQDVAQDVFCRLLTDAAAFIADELVCSPATVRTRLHRARKQMRQVLEPDLEDEEGHHEQADVRPV